VNNGDQPNCEQVQQLKCAFCFSHVVPHTLIEKRTKGKKGIIAYNTSFGISSLRQHVEVEHLEFFNAYVAKFVGVENNLGSQSRNVDGKNVVQLAKKQHQV
jgi:hypothetical protein